MKTYLFHRKNAALVLLLSAMVGAPTAFAQSVEELRVAAETWLQREQIKMKFQAANGWTSTFETNLKAKITNFVGSNDPYCLGSHVSTTISVIENQLVLDFAPRSGCQRVQYRFSPITGEGAIFVGPADSALLTPTTSKAKVSLVKE